MNHPPFQRFRRKPTFIEARPYVSGESLEGISVSDEDRTRFLEGGMIARNPDNPKDQWYINVRYFSQHYEILG